MSLSPPAARPGRLRIGVVGTGRAGSVLGAALRAAGHPVVAVSAVSRASRGRAADLLPGVPVMDPPAVVARCDLALLTVPDDALAGLVTGLVQAGSVRPGQVLVHVAGAHGLGVLGPAVARGAQPLALHPVMVLSGVAADLDRLRGACFGVSAPPGLRAVAEALVVEMGGEPVWVDEDARAVYHAALCHAANHLVTILAQAAEALRAAGVADPRALLAPLVAAATDSALAQGDAALTGPVVRGDAETVRAHLQGLQAGLPEVAATYRALARATAVRALGAGRLRPLAAEGLLAVLATPAGAQP